MVARQPHKLGSLRKGMAYRSAAMTLSLSFPRCYDGGFVSRKGIIEGDFILGEAKVHAALGGGV